MKYTKDDIDLTWKKKLLLSGVFIQKNRLHAIMDRYLKEVTGKQLFLMVVTDAYDVPPDLSTLAKHLECSRQNIKKLAVSLEKSGMVNLKPSESDRRSLCVEITEKGKLIIEHSNDLIGKVNEAVFREFSEQDIEDYFRLSAKMMNGFDHLEELLQSIEPII